MLNQEKLVYIEEEQLRKHNTRDDLWVAIDNKVYDITNLVNKHPGGPLTLEAVAGKNVSEIFMVYHPESTYKQIEIYYIGELKQTSSISEQRKRSDLLLKDFRQLHHQFTEEGLYQTSYYYYLKRILVSLGLFIGVWYFMLKGRDEGSYMMQFISSILLGVFFQQTAFMGHDAGHTAIFHNRKRDVGFGFLIGNTLTGISIGWWKDSHNTHHVIPNDVNYDPDIQHLPFFAVTDKFFKSVYSKYHEKFLVFDRIGAFIIQYQHYLYYPIMGIARLFLYLQSMLFILGFKPRKCEFFWQEGLGHILFFLWMKILFSQTLNYPMLVLCFLISHAIGGILHIQITLSHFGMETFQGNDHYTEKLNFVELQLKSTMDILNPTFLDWFHGGLQFQLAHHLFPRMPRHNLHLVRSRVSQMLLKHDIQYNIKNFYDANLYTFQQLKKQAQILQSKDFQKSLIWDGLNARG